MELFIRADDIFMEIHKVSLKDGHIPMIGDHLPEFLNENLYGYCNSSQIEPAVWFKVKVVDSISIDCFKRSIIWNIDSSFPEKDVEFDSDGDKVEKSELDSAKQVGRRRKVSESMYLGGEFYGFDSDLDDLFETLQQAVLKFASSDITREKFNEIVMKMLHLHVLPVIKLTSEDITKINQVFADQEKFIDQVDQEIIQKHKQADQVMAAMQRQREKFIRDFVRVSNGKSTLTPAGKLCPHKFAEVLLSDVEGDINMLYEKLDSLQKVVEDAKVVVKENSRDTVDSADHEELREKRAERDNCHQEYERLLHARENLRIFLAESRRINQNPTFKESLLKSLKNSHTRQGDPIHNVYLGMSSKLAEIKNEAQLLVQKKVMIISVKEGIRNTLQELKQHQESLGYEINKPHGSRATDVLRRSSKPREWLTMAEQVAQLVEDKHKWIHNAHNAFCKEVTERCDAAVFEKKLLEVSHNAVRIGSDSHPLYRQSTSSSGSNSGVYVENKLFCLKNSASFKDSLNTSSDDAKESSDCVKDGTGSPNSSCRSSSQSDTSDGSTERLSHSQSSSGYTSQVESSNVQSSVFSQDASYRSSLVQLEGVMGDDDIVIVHNTERDSLRKTIEELKPKICQHFQSVCSWLEKELGNSSQVAYRKVWLCYEHHFFDVMIGPLMSLYEAAFAQVTQRIRARIPHLSVKDLDLEGTVISNMLQEKHAAVFVDLDDVDISVESSKRETDLEGESHLDANLNNVSEKAVENHIDANDGNSPEEMPLIIIDDDDNNVATSVDPPREDAVMQELPIAPKGSLYVTTSEGTSKAGAFRGRSKSNPAQDPPHWTSGFPCQYSPRGEEKSNLRRIKIYYPVSVTVVYSRRTWPPPKLPDIAERNEDIEFGEEAFKLDKKIQCLEVEDSNTNCSNIRRNLFQCSDSDSLDGVAGPCVEREIRLKPRYLKRFSPAIECLEEAMKCAAPLNKLQYLTRCIREISNQISDYQREDLNMTCGACADDLIDMLVILLLNCDVETTSTLYPHLMFLSDVLPSFFEGGPYEFCLIQFSGAFQFIQDRLLMLNHNRD